MERDGHRKLHLTADVTKAVAEEDPERRAGIKEYEDHKESFAKNIQFDGNNNISPVDGLKVLLVDAKCKSPP